MQERSNENALLEEALAGRGRLHLDDHVCLTIPVVPRHDTVLVLVLVTLRMDQRLVKVEDEKLVEVFLLKGELDFIFLGHLGKLLDLLNNIYRLDHLHRHVLVDGDLQRGVWEVFELLK